MKTRLTDGWVFAELLLTSIQWLRHTGWTSLHLHLLVDPSILTIRTSSQADWSNLNSGLSGWWTLGTDKFSICNVAHTYIWTLIWQNLSSEFSSSSSFQEPSYNGCLWTTFWFGSWYVKFLIKWQWMTTDFFQCLNLFYCRKWLGSKLRYRHLTPDGIRLF